MQINNAQTLLTQMNAGANIKLSGDQLVTQNKASAFFQRIGDVFRSNATIAARNERLLVAMGNMLQGGGGPQNLAAAGPVTNEQRLAAVANAKAALIETLTNQSIDTLHAGKAPEERAAMKDFASKFMAGNQDRILPGDSSLRGLRAASNNLMTLFDKPSVQRAMAEFTPVNLGPADMQPTMTAIQEMLQNFCTADRAAVGQDGTRKSFGDENIYSVAVKDFPRDRPMIGGVKIQSYEEGAARLTAFSPHPDEREIISYLMTQTAMMPTQKMEMEHKLGGPEGDSPLTSGVGSLPGATRQVLTRDENGDARIHMTVARSLNGSCAGVSFNNTRVGVVQYDVVVPHEQFAQGVPPGQNVQLRVENMTATPMPQ